MDNIQEQSETSITKGKQTPKDIPDMELYQFKQILQHLHMNPWLIENNEDYTKIYRYTSNRVHLESLFFKYVPILGLVLMRRGKNTKNSNFRF